MKYEITSDMSDLYVLSRNTVVILITRDMSEITAKLLELDTEYRNKVEKAYEEAEIKTKDTTVETRSLRERVSKKPEPHSLVELISEKPSAGALGILFKL